MCVIYIMGYFNWLWRKELLRFKHGVSRHLVLSDEQLNRGKTNKGWMRR